MTRKRAIEKNIIQMKNHLQKYDVGYRKNKIQDRPYLVLEYRKNPPSVIIDGEVPEEFLIRQEPLVNKKAIKELLKKKRT